MKGADINVAAYMSELAFLASPVSSHVQTAEMGNQAINSLAFISARYTHTAIDCLSNICASYLYVLCQALDLRVMDVLFAKAMEPVLRDVTTKIFKSEIQHPHTLETLQSQLLKHVLKHLPTTTQLDSRHRAQDAAEAVQSTLTTFLYTHCTLPKEFDVLGAIRGWTFQFSESLYQTFTHNRDRFFAKPDATPYLGAASRRMYAYVRNDLQVPFNRGLADRPQPGNGMKTIGSNISVIYEAMRSGRLYGPVLDCLKGDCFGNGA